MPQGKKIPEHTWKRFLELLGEQTTSVAATCRILNITPHSYYNYRLSNLEFAEQVDIIFDTIRRPFAEDALFSLIAEKNLGAIKFFLMQRGGKRWNESRLTEIMARAEANILPPEVLEEQRPPTDIEKLMGKIYLSIVDGTYEMEKNGTVRFPIDPKEILRIQEDND